MICSTALFQCGEAAAHQRAQPQVVPNGNSPYDFKYIRTGRFPGRFAVLLLAFALLLALPVARAFASGGGEAAAEGHGGEKASLCEHAIAPELPNIFTVACEIAAVKESPMLETFIKLVEFQNVIFYCGIAILLMVVSFLGTRRLKKIPSGFQALLEMVVVGLDNFVCGILGPRGRAYVPLCGTIFIFILCCNLMGLVPLAKSPIALNINGPATWAICVFFFVQYHGIRENGFIGYVKHFVEPLPLPLLPITILLVVIHIIGELAKPITLMFRLFGNITAEDVVIAALVILAAGIPVVHFLPLQVLFFPLGLLFSLIQAVVFTVLTAVYILLMFGHEHEGAEEH